MRSAPAVIATLAIATLALASCTATDPEPTGGPETPPAGAQVDPDATVDVGLVARGDDAEEAARLLAGNVYEGLVRLDDAGETTPLLADDVAVSDDGLTYTITLREGVRFHSGEPLTADDVVASVERAAADDSAFSGRDDLARIAAISADDERTVTISLTEASVTFPRALAGVWIARADTPEDVRLEPDGTGPYAVEGQTPGSSLQLARFEGYWGDPAANGGVTFHLFSDAPALENALVAGAVDIIADQPTPSAIESLGANSALVVHEGASTSAARVAFNATRAPFADARVRQAVSSAIDDEAVREAVWGDYGELTGSSVSPDAPWYEDLTSLDPYDPDAARDLLEEAGAARGLRVVLAVEADSPYVDAATLIQAQLAEVSVRVDIRELSADELDAASANDPEIDAILDEHVDDDGLDTLADPAASWGYANPEVSEWVQQSKLVTSAAERAELLKLAARGAAEDASSEWLFRVPHIVAASEQVAGYPLREDAGSFFAARIEKSV